MSEVRQFVNQWSSTTKLLQNRHTAAILRLELSVAGAEARDHRDAAAGLPVDEAMGASA